MKKILLIETDGVVLNDGQLIPGIIRQLYRIGHELGYHLVFVSEKNFPNELTAILNGEDVHFQQLLISNDLPKTAIDEKWEIAASSLVSKGTGANVLNLPVVKFAGNWQQVYESLRPKREAIVHRKTNETDIAVQLNLDGQGRSEVHTGIGFFDHMLDQVAKHSISDLIVAVQGDLYIDEHHTVEDTALALGEAFIKALGDKRGIERYGFALPMDDCLAQVGIDFGGRPWLVWNADFKREKIGEMPTELFYHFFKSFSDAAKCNLNIQCEGDNEHHKIEAIFKAFAKAIKMAKKRDAGNDQLLPSTKGVL